MATRHQPVQKTGSWLPAALIVLSFLSSGAWMITTLPPVPIAKALNLISVGLWALAFAVGLVAWSKPDRRLVWGLIAVGGAVALAYALGGSAFVVLVYDLFADMPLAQWLGLLAVFVLAAGLRADARGVGLGLDIVLSVGTVLAAVLAYQVSTTNGTGVFGSTAYSITALVPLIPIAVVRAHAANGIGRIARYAAALVIAVALGFFSGSLMGLVGVVFAALVSVAVHPALAGLKSGIGRGVRVLSMALAALAVAGLLIAQMPALSGSILTPERLASFDKNIVTRAYLWDGAQRMLADRPVAGFGPSGYRTFAVEYLDPEALQFGADQAGNIDPTVYSPQSPHSVFWEMATRLGVLGLLAFAFLLGCWSLVVRDHSRSGQPDAALRLGIAGGFAAAAFVLLVNPVVFPIGLFAAAAAGIAAGRWGGTEPTTPTPTSVRAAFGVAAILFLGVGVWLGTGEWRAYTAPRDNSFATVAAYQAALEQLPGNPAIQRRLFETQLLLAADAHEVAIIQSDVDAAPQRIGDFAPNLVSLATYSLAQADRTGRTDVAWEQGMLDRASEVLPPIPSLVAERLHAAVISGDVDAMEAAIPPAEEWGSPYPYAEDYLARARALTE